MTAWLILLAVVVAGGLGAWLVFRSRKEPEGSSRVEPERMSRSGAEIPWDEEDGDGSEGIGTGDVGETPGDPTRRR